MYKGHPRTRGSRGHAEQACRQAPWGLAAAVLAIIVGLAPASGQTPLPASGGPVEAGVIEDLVAANRILADQGVLDGFGHVSIRHPADPSRYLCRASWRRRS